jgi:hypothetical protein
MLDDAGGTTMLGLAPPADAADRAERALDSTTLALVRHHCAGRVAVPLLDAGDESDWAAAGAAGITLAAARPLVTS